MTRRTIAALLAAGSSAKAAPKKQAAAMKAIEQADLDFCAATKAKGLDGWMSYFADDATAFPSGKPLIHGKAALREYYAAAIFATPGLTIDWRPVKADAAASGDLGYTIGTAEFRFPGKDGKLVTRPGKYLTVWKKQPGGQWKVVADLGN
jgi:ketosteroid isomerase-like protein